MSETLEAKLIGLGFPKKGIQADVDIFMKVKSISDLENEITTRHYTGDVEQYLLPRFRVLYERTPEVRERVSKELGNLGVPANLVGAYFTEWGNQPYLLLHFTHEEIPLDARKKFVSKAQEVMLQLVREHVGVA